MTDLPACLYEPDGDLFVPTGLTRGPWDRGFQHAGPPAALLAHAVEARRGVDPGQVGRLGYDILRPVPLAPHRVDDARRCGPAATSSRSRATLSDAASGDALMRLNAWRLRAEELELPDGLGEPDPPPPPPRDGGISLPKFWTEQVAYHAALDWRFIARRLRRARPGGVLDAPARAARRGRGGHAARAPAGDGRRRQRHLATCSTGRAGCSSTSSSASTSSARPRASGWRWTRSPGWARRGPACARACCPTSAGASGSQLKPSSVAAAVVSAAT